MRLFSWQLLSTKYLSWLPLTLLGSVLLNHFMASPVKAQLSPEEINSIAKQTTVLIAPGLTPELMDELEENYKNPLATERNPDGVWNPGSGVIIAKQGNTYYVLTVTHNFKQRHLNKNISYGIRTGDGKVHEVQQVNDGRGCPLQSKIELQQKLIRFGCYARILPTRVEGLDLAIVSFESEEDYVIASLGNPDNIKIRERVYVSGWPDPEKERGSNGRCRGKVTRRQRRLAWGPITGKIDPNQGQNGYGLFYLDQTRPGMSGGPVFDQNGFVIGVHGRGSQDKGALVTQYCSVPEKLANTFESEDLATQTIISDPFILHTRFSSGQNLQNFANFTTQIGINLPFNLLPPNPEMIQVARTNLQGANSGSNTVDFDISENNPGVFDDPKDVVNDIYNIFEFKLENQMRDQPSGGCGSLLLGDERERCNRL